MAGAVVNQKHMLPATPSWPSIEKTEPVMPKHIPKTQRQPRYKKAMHNSKNHHNLVFYTEQPRHVVRLGNKGLRYTNSLIGSLVMPVGALAIGGIIGFVIYMAFHYYAGLHDISGIMYWVFILMFAPVWLWCSESWWFGLTTRKFADVYPDKIIVYGAWGRKRYQFSRHQCRFFYIDRRGTPALWVKCSNRKLPIRIDNALCADWQDFLYETGAVDWATGSSLRTMTDGPKGTPQSRTDYAGGGYHPFSGTPLKYSQAAG